MLLLASQDLPALRAPPLSVGTWAGTIPCPTLRPLVPLPHPSPPCTLHLRPDGSGRAGAEQGHDGERMGNEGENGQPMMGNDDDGATTTTTTMIHAILSLAVRSRPSPFAVRRSPFRPCPSPSHLRPRPPVTIRLSPLSPLSPSPSPSPSALSPFRPPRPSRPCPPPHFATSPSCLSCPLASLALLPLLPSCLSRPLALSPSRCRRFASLALSRSHPLAVAVLPSRPSPSRSPPGLRHHPIISAIALCLANKPNKGWRAEQTAEGARGNPATGRGGGKRANTPPTSCGGVKGPQRRAEDGGCPNGQRRG
ncbi:unnamed protein product [Cyclocybe aegerita]|uniref:Uncharacterized protein n=1 Tax=Cyclocybe aegerita TaxID=1973307 RepID=A0A8S0W0K1_CYCAE|nr:unnamed protein product [Cyclocybe aegerita]